MRCCTGMRIRGGLFVALLLIGVSCTQEELGPGHYRWEGIRGFAIWPEDRPEDGWSACEERIQEEPWRADPAATAHEFVSSVLGWRHPTDISESDVPEDAPRTAFSMGDGQMPNWALGIVVHLRQLKGCWFVASVLPREADVAAQADWVERDGRFVLRVEYSGSGSANLEVGWGDVVHSEVLRRGETVSIPVPDPESSGHILWYPEGGPSERTFGHPLSPPPRFP
jgi:hypothetical protein